VNTEYDLARRLLADAVTPQRGHFLYESGHHGDLWLELDGLLGDARRLRDWTAALADEAAACRPDIVCGPLTGGAFVAQFLAAELGAGFAYAERIAAADGGAAYRLPRSLRPTLRAKRILLADDAVNAGSALLATLKELHECGGLLVGLASLLALGDAPARLAAETGAPFFALLTLERGLWLPADCPLCAAGMPLIDPLARPGRRP
jgi:orotate phosphoribosyltransferase